MKFLSHKIFPFVLFLISSLLVIPHGVFAVEVSRYSGVPVKNDIILSPAKVELSLDAGTRSVKYLNVMNRIGRDAVFSISVEDFASSAGTSGEVVLGKTVEGLKSSLKRYISVETSGFILAHGEQARIPVIIDLPKGISPGGLYASVIIAGSPQDSAPGAAKVVTRLGSLFFVRVNGVISQSGSLENISFADDGFEITFKNDGDIYLNPHGVINIYDTYKNLVRSVNLDPWFVLPKSVRTRMVAVSDLPSGKYIANVSIYRGYSGIKDVRDSKEIDFELLSADNSLIWWVWLVVVLLILFLCKKYL